MEEKVEEILKRLEKEGYRADDLKHYLYNTCTNSSGYHYVRILKAYKSPKLNLKFKEGKDFVNHPLINQFSLRFYLPKEPLSLKGSDKNILFPDGVNNSDPKIKHLVIIVNGLNEILPDHFKFYDFLGMRFAEKGIASVLLSTPYHLHRVQQEFDDSVNKKRIVIPHKKFKSPLDFYLHYLITQSEIIDIAKRVKQAESIGDPDDFGFYENHFNKDVKITLLGYSLGGLISLGTLLKINSKENRRVESKLIDTCILYNSAPRLAHATTSDIGISSDEWHDLWEEFSDPETDEIINKCRIGSAIDNSFFKDLYIGVRTTHLKHSLTKQLLRENSKKLLLVMSGADDIIDTKAWDDYLTFNEGDRQKTIINEFIFAGVGHSPMKEAQGAETLPRIVEVMTDHILKNQQEHWQEQQIVDMMAELLLSTNYLERVNKGIEDSYLQDSFDRKSMRQVLGEINDELKQKKFIKLYYLSKIYFPKFKSLIDAIINKQKRKNK